MEEEERKRVSEYTGLVHVFLLNLFNDYKKTIKLIFLSLLIVYLLLYCVHKKEVTFLRHGMKMMTLCRDKDRCYLNIPEPELRTVIRSTGDQVSVIRTPGQVSHSERMTFEGSQQLQLVALLQKDRIKIIILKLILFPKAVPSYSPCNTDSETSHTSSKSEN